jgi:Secretion system C-terminal sorting domain/Carboxylesterase family/alpha/beta hydrolase fold
MKYAWIFLLGMAACLVLPAQQWLDKKYEYDSTLNVTYGTAVNFNGGVETLKMDIYTPRCDDATHTSTRPLMVWIHGGAFLAGYKEDPSITYLCKEFAKRGYVTASISYRLGFVSDDAAWTCNYPNYSCVFAADTAEWIRASYRAMQDGKGAVRYLVNRHQLYRIDTDNIFVAGESAGAILALSVALMDTSAERPPQTFALGDVPKPNANTMACQHNMGQGFPNAMVSRPDLGGIDGTIEPTTIPYTIKGVGNNYGAMVSNLLKLSPANRPKPAIYSFHQPCDLVVPIDSGVVFQLLNWCFTNGYNCYAVANSAKIYGSRTMSTWNTANSYGYNIHDEFTATTFPYNFLFGPGSCADQVNYPCHAYDNAALRQNNLAAFFAPLITTSPICDTMLVAVNRGLDDDLITVFPNPATDKLVVQSQLEEQAQLQVVNLHGVEVLRLTLDAHARTVIDLATYPSGIYFLHVRDAAGAMWSKAWVKI